MQNYSGSRVCLKNHSRNLYAPLCGIFHPNLVAVARYGALIRAKSPTNCDAHLAESLFQTRSRACQKAGREQSLPVFKALPPEFQRAFTCMFLKNPAEIPLIMIAAHFPDLFHGQTRLMDQKALGVAHAQGDQIFGRGTTVDLAENFGQVAGTVVHVICDQVQINVLAVVFYNEIFQ